MLSQPCFGLLEFLFGRFDCRGKDIFLLCGLVVVRFSQFLCGHLHTHFGTGNRALKLCLLLFRADLFGRSTSLCRSDDIGGGASAGISRGFCLGFFSGVAPRRAFLLFFLFRAFNTLLMEFKTLASLV